MLKFIVDTNVIIDLSKMFTAGLSHSNNKRVNKLTPFFLLLELDEAQLCVVPKVCEEIKSGSHKDGGNAEFFMDRFCKKIELDSYEEETAINLAFAYGHTKVGDLPPILDARNEKGRNYSDALIIAQASVAQAKEGQKMPIITENLKDMINVYEINKINDNFDLPPVAIYSSYAIEEAINVAGKDFSK